MISEDLYRKICYCEEDNEQFDNLYLYGFHVVTKHSGMNFSILSFQNFIRSQIIKQLDKNEMYNQQTDKKQKQILSEIKKQLKKETPEILKMLIPKDGRKMKSKKKSQSKKSRRSKKI